MRRYQSLYCRSVPQAITIRSCTRDAECWNAVGMSSGYDHRESQVSFRQIQDFRRHDNGIAELSVLSESIYKRPWCLQWIWRKTRDKASSTWAYHCERTSSEETRRRCLIWSKKLEEELMVTFSRFALIGFTCCKASALINPQYSSLALFDLAILLIEIKPPFLGQGYFYWGTCRCKSCQSWTRQVIH